MAQPRMKRRTNDLLDSGTPARPVPLGRYEVIGQIGRGGMANVYHGRIKDSDERYAIKCMKPKLAQEERFIDMFTKEAKLALLLKHPGIVETFDSGQAEGRYFIAMEYIAGQDLSAVLKRAKERKKRLSVPHVLHVIYEVARALDYAHNLKATSGQSLNIVNRDISPANIRLSYEGQVKMIDFGIAQATVQVSSEIGVLKGKFAYMSPEQIRGLPVDARSDLFSLGAVAHELLTSERLFREESEFALMEKVRSQAIKAPSEIDSRVPNEVDRVIMKMLEREPAQRVQSAAEVMQALEPIIADYQFEQAELGQLVRTLFSKEFRIDRANLLRAAQGNSLFADGDVGYAEFSHENEKPKRRDDSFTIFIVAGFIALAAVVMMVIAFI